MQLLSERLVVCSRLNPLLQHWNGVSGSSTSAPPTTANPLASAQPSAVAGNLSAAAESVPPCAGADISAAFQSFAIAAATPTTGTQEHVQDTVGQGIKSLCDLLAQQDVRSITMALEGLEKTLQVRRSLCAEQRVDGSMDSCVLLGIRRFKFECGV